MTDSLPSPTTQPPPPAPVAAAGSAPPDVGTPAGPPTPWGPVTPPAPAAENAGAWVLGLILVAIGGMLLLGRWVPDAGQYIVLAIGLVFLVAFFISGEYGFLVPGGIVTGIGAGIPLAAAYAGELGGGLFLVAFGAGFLLIWVLGELMRVPERHWWPLVPGLIIGSIGVALTAGERGRGVADAINTAWPIVLIAGGLLLLVRAFRGRPS